MSTILLVRHAQGSFGEADYDALSELGVRQVAMLVHHVTRRGITVHRVVSGALTRQLETAAPIAAAAGRTTIVDPRWDEYDADDILSVHSSSPVRLGRRDDSAPPVSARDFQDVLEGALEAWLDAHDAGPAGETWPAFAGRVRTALAELADSLPSGTTAVVATSAGALAAICVALLELPDAALLAFNRVAVNCGVTKLVHGRRGTTLISFNDHAHLELPGESLISYR